MSAPEAVPRAAAAALQTLLAERYASPVAVDRWEQLEPWAVARVRLRSAAAPHSVVVKWTRAAPARARTAAWRLRNESAALQFLGDDVGGGLVPRVIAADMVAGILVLEDLAPRVALDRLLRRDGAAAHNGRLAAFARARGELSAVTAGRAESYYARRAALGPVDPAADLVDRSPRSGSRPSDTPRRSGHPSTAGPHPILPPHWTSCTTRARSWYSATGTRKPTTSSCTPPVRPTPA
ncbi:hypothetical protein [Peterkaempfera sp. SMS 1(5)a]|uniref:hypothetical protein n=1 Tax=Peterkaempfera podocarpi TaxID=3232308 RepID=UPI00366F91C4